MTTGQDHILSAVRTALGSNRVAGCRVCVALSGGMDSVALLHALAQLQPEMGFELSAIHVHHGLSSNADSWAEFCQALCQQLGLFCRVVRLSLPESRGKGVERVAREGRYAAFAEVPGDILCLAHHQNDRAETFLLNLFRGAGAIGLSAVPATRLLGQKRLLRPLIDIPRQALRSWAEMHDLHWIEDESNDDLRFRRNYLRHRVLPAITEVFPGVVAVLSRTAGHMAEQVALLDRLAQIDGLSCRDVAGLLSVRRLQSQPEPVVRNILRFELFKAGINVPGAARLGSLSAQLMLAEADAETFIAMGTVGIHLWRDHIWLDAAMDRPAPQFNEIQAGVIDWPDGRLLVTMHETDPSKIQICPLGRGRRFQPAGRCRDSLSELLRAQGVPPWIRPRLPGLWNGSELLWVAGLGWAAEGSATVIPHPAEIEWEAQEPKRL